MLDENGRVIEDNPETQVKLSGETRVYRVMLDCNQYQQDMELTSKGKLNELYYFGLIVTNRYFKVDFYIREISFEL